MTRDRSLDEFAGGEEDTSAADDVADERDDVGGEEDGADVGRGPDSDEEIIDAGAGPESDEQDVDGEAGAERGEGTADSPDTAGESDDVEPVTATYRWDSDGIDCPACGATVDRLWSGETGPVCAECKEW